ncbi:unnamed protein product [Symbiodinium sp. KB8]|nr:unnamed protein product [Symbiodinium sp. KB8]
MRREAPKHEQREGKSEHQKTLERALERASEIAKEASPEDAAYRESLLKEALKLVEQDGEKSSAAVQLEVNEAQNGFTALRNSTTPGATTTTTSKPSSTTSTEASKTTTEKSTTTTKKATTATTTRPATTTTTKRAVTFDIVTTKPPPLAAPVLSHAPPVTLPSDMSHDQHDHMNGDEWNAHISDHWGMHGGGHEPVQETEPWSIHTDAGAAEHDEADGWHDVLQHGDDDHASHPMPEDDMHHIDDIHHMDPMVHEPEEMHHMDDIHHMDPMVHEPEEMEHELPHVHISVEPPASGSPPLAVEDYDHPMAPVAPPTPPLTDQAMKDSSAAGEEAADAAMQMGLPAERQASVAAAAAAAAAAADGMSHDQQAAAAKEAADHARWSAGTSSTQPPIPEHFEDPTIETWPMTFKAKGCHKAACGPIDGLFHEVGENEGHPMYAKDGEEDVTLYFLNHENMAKRGWWVGKFPGSTTTYAFNPSEDVLPPMFGWHVPWDSPLPYVGLEFVKTEDHGAEFDKAPKESNHSHMPPEEWVRTAEHLEHLEHSEHLPTEPMPAYEASHCLNESVAPKGSWVVYNGTDGAHSQLPAFCKGFDSNALVPEECCHIPNLPNIFSVKFEEVYVQHGECASIEGHGLFLESFKIKLRCNSDNSIIYGHDCNAGCQCGSEHVYQHGCYRGVDRIPSTTWFFIVGGCECDSGLPTPYQAITGHAGPELHIDELPALEVSGGQDPTTAHVIVGIYKPVGIHHDKPSFKKTASSTEDEVSIYYGPSSSGEAEGWWIGSGAGTAHVYAFNPNKEELPPFRGWKAPWWSGVDMTVKVDIVDKDHHRSDTVRDLQEHEEHEDHDDHHEHEPHEHDFSDDLDPHEDEAMKPEDVMPLEDHSHGEHHPEVDHFAPIMDAFSKANEGTNQQILKALKAMMEHMKDVEKTVEEMQEEMHPVSPVHPLDEAENASFLSAKALTASGCSTEAMRDKIEGKFSPAGFYLGHPVYHRQSGGHVLIYYHHDGDDASLHGWWFGPDTMEFGTSQNWAFNSEDSVTPPLSGWHVPWNGPVDPAFKLTEAAEEAMSIVKNHSTPPEEHIEEPMQVPTDGDPLPPEPTPPVSERPEHANLVPPSANKDLNPEQAREVIQDQAKMIAAAVKQLSSGKDLADLVFGIDTKIIPHEPPSDEFIARLAQDPKLAKKALEKLVTVLSEANRRLESGEAFADEIFGRHMDKWSAEAEPNVTEVSAIASTTSTTVAPSGTEPPIENSAAAPLLKTVDKVATAANAAAEKARKWKAAEIAEAQAQHEAEQAKKEVETMTVQAAKEEAEKAIEQAADEEAREAKQEATKEAESAEGEAKDKATKVAAAKQKLEELKGQVPKEAKDAADKALHTAEEHVQMKEEKVHEARFALEDLGAEAPPEVKEAAEEALSKAEEEADAAKTEVEEAQHTLDAMKNTVTPEQRQAAEKELEQAQEEAKQAEAKAKDAAKKAGDIKLTSHDPASDNVLYTDSQVKEEKGGAVVMGSEPQTDTEKDLQEQLAALQSKLTGMERLQVKDKLDDQLKDNLSASLSQADSELAASARDVQVHAVKAPRALAEKSGEEPEVLVATKEQQARPKKGKGKGSGVLLVVLVLTVLIGAVAGAVFLKRRRKTQGTQEAKAEEAQPLLEQKEANGNAEAGAAAEEAAAGQTESPVA